MNAKNPSTGSPATPKGGANTSTNEQPASGQPIPPDKTPAPTEAELDALDKKELEAATKELETAKGQLKDSSDKLMGMTAELDKLKAHVESLEAKNKALEIELSAALDGKMNDSGAAMTADDSVDVRPIVSLVRALPETTPDGAVFGGYGGHVITYGTLRAVAAILVRSGV